LVRRDKQTQSNPIQSQFKPNSQNEKNEHKLFFNRQLRRKLARMAPQKQTQSNPIYRGAASGEAGSNSKLGAVTKILKISWTTSIKPAKIALLRFKLKSEVNSYGT
jgi:hypothetical protein